LEKKAAMKKGDVEGGWILPRRNCEGEEGGRSDENVTAGEGEGIGEGVGKGEGEGEGDEEGGEKGGVGREGGAEGEEEEDGVWASRSGEESGGKRSE